MARLVYNNFLNGMVSARMRRRADSTVYQTSARLMENLLPIKTGGFTLRDGTVSEIDGIQAERIIPYIKSVNERYLIALTENNVFFYAYDNDLGKFRLIGNSLEEKYKSGEINDIQYTQNYEYLIMVHKNHPPMVCSINPSDEYPSGYWVQFNPIKLDDETNAVGDDGAKIVWAYEDADNFLIKDSHPSCVAFCANRLWFASTISNPYTIWGSQPFKPFNFQKEEYYSYVDDEQTVANYMQAVQGETESTTQNADGSTTIVSTEIIFDEQNKPTGQMKRIIKQCKPDGSCTETPENVEYLKPKTKWEKTITEACSIKLEVGSERNETIQWISASSDIVIGTSSSEWLIPRGISALQQQIYPISAYGSVDSIQAIRCADNIFYIQSGGKKLRGLVGSGNGYQNADLCYYCHDILDAGVVSIAWQRVPEQRCYCLLKDGTIAVLSYDPSYGMNAWSVITFKGKAVSLCVMDTPEGQDIYVVVVRDGISYLERFDSSTCRDNSERYGFLGILDTNGIDVSDTVSYNKGVNSVYVDSNGNPFRVCQKGHQIEMAKVTGNMTRVPVFGSRTDDELIVHLESIEGEPLEVLALITEVKA